MKKSLLYLALILVSIGCKTEELQNPPTAVTKIASDITLKNATLNGEITDEGYSATSERGFVISDKNSNPSASDTKLQSGYGKGIFSIVLDKLSVNTTYYFKAYATNTKGMSYGELQSFTTGDYNLASLNTDVPKNITLNSVELAGNVTNEGGGSVIERGFCIGLNPNPTTTDNKYSVTTKGLGSFTLVVVNLKENTKYYARSFAINEKGIVYGIEQNFTTLFKEITRDFKTTVVEVTSKSGRIWMDRNLGASQIATSSTDINAYGDLYQWGRASDGHQLRNSQNSSQQSSSDLPNSSNFILSPISTMNWRVPKNDGLWQGVNGTNNVCPTGFRLPTKEEWVIEMSYWIPKNATGAYLSPLKLTIGGARSFESGGIYGVSESGFYWSSSIGGQNTATDLVFGAGASLNDNPRGDGFSVRCIKN